MAIVSFYPDRRSVEVPRGSTILQAAQMAGIMLETPCNCVGICAKCAVRLDVASLRNITTTAPCSREGIALEHAWVLSCQTEVLGDISVEVPSPEQCRYHQDFKLRPDAVGQPNQCIKKTYSEEKGKTSVFALDRLLAERSRAIPARRISASW